MSENGKTGGREARGARMLAVTAALVIGLGLTGAARAGAKAGAKTGDSGTQIGSEELQWAWSLPAGKTIEIKGVNGSIRARRATDHRVQVKAWKHARRSDPASVTVDIVEHEGGVTVCAVYPPSWMGGKNTCAPGKGGHLNARDNDVVVDFEVEVPSGIGLIARTVNGRVEAASLEGTIQAHTVNGQVAVSTSKRAEATTVNGSIVARLGTTGGGSLDFSTVNGSITLELPGSVDADLHARTVNGAIESDYPISVTGRLNRRTVDGTLGKGGPELRLETVNGSIRLRKASI